MAKKEVEVVEKKIEENSENKVEEVIEKKSLAKKNYHVSKRTEDNNIPWRYRTADIEQQRGGAV